MNNPKSFTVTTTDKPSKKPQDNTSYSVPINFTSYPNYYKPIHDSPPHMNDDDEKPIRDPPPYYHRETHIVPEKKDVVHTA